MQGEKSYKMRVHRIYYPHEIIQGRPMLLDREVSHYLKTVLRVSLGQMISLFDGQGRECSATVTQFQGKNVLVEAGSWVLRSVESPLQITLAQGISRGEKMDFTLQKAVELGVTHIVPLITERVGVKFDEARAEHRLLHWQKVIISACEQSGRTCVPILSPIRKFEQWIPESGQALKLILDPHLAKKMNLSQGFSACTLLVGPEGGFSSKEVEQAIQAGFQAWQLGPRILRTETAAMVALSILQYSAGDLSV